MAGVGINAKFCYGLAKSNPWHRMVSLDLIRSRLRGQAEVFWARVQLERSGPRRLALLLVPLLVHVPVCGVRRPGALVVAIP